MIDLSRNGYTHNQVRDVLHMKHGSRQVRFRYFLLDKNENEKRELKNVESGSIEQAAFSSIKRTAKFRLKDNGNDINWHSDRIQVFIEFKVPNWFERSAENRTDTFFIHPTFPVEMDYVYREWTHKDGGWIDFSLGVFLLSSPTKAEEGNAVYREIEAYDKLLIMKEDKVTDRYTIKSGTRYYDAMTNLLNSAGIPNYNIENNDKILNKDMEFEPGTEKLAILNDLASNMNYTPFWVDEYGYFRSNQYRSPQEQSSDYTYEDNELSITELGMEEELDLFDLPNVFYVTVSNPDEDVEFTSVAENMNTNHPRSIPNLGRRVVRYEEKDDIADQESLDSYVERIAFEASQIYGKIKFNTAIMPFHSYSNVIRVRNSTLGVNDKYAETKWSMDLEAGADMSHEVRKVVSLV